MRLIRATKKMMLKNLGKIRSMIQLLHEENVDLEAEVHQEVTEEIEEIEEIGDTEDTDEAEETEETETIKYPEASTEIEVSIEKEVAIHIIHMPIREKSAKMNLRL